MTAATFMFEQADALQADTGSTFFNPAKPVGEDFAH